MSITINNITPPIINFWVIVKVERENFVGKTVDGDESVDGVESVDDDGRESADGGEPVGGEPDGGEPDGGEPVGGEPDGGEPDGGVEFVDGDGDEPLLVLDD